MENDGFLHGAGVSVKTRPLGLRGTRSRIGDLTESERVSGVNEFCSEIGAIEMGGIGSLRGFLLPIAHSHAFQEPCGSHHSPSAG